MRFLIAVLLFLSLCSLSKKKRGAPLNRSFEAAFEQMVADRYMNYRLNFSKDYFSAKINFGNQPYRPILFTPVLNLPGYSSDPVSESLKYLNFNTIDPKKHYPGMILNRPVPFNSPLLKKYILRFGINVPI